MTAGLATPPGERAAAIVLVRHASTAWSGRRYCGRSDPWLDAAGRLAADRLAAELAAEMSGEAPVDGLEQGPPRLVSSPRRRARQTSAAIARLAGIGRVEIDDRWREVDFGSAEGRRFDQLQARAPALAARLLGGEADIDWPDGERHRDLLARVESAWRSIIEAAAPCIVETHAGPMRIALALASGRPLAEIDLPAPGAVVRLPAGLSGSAVTHPDRNVLVDRAEQERLVPR